MARPRLFYVIYENGKAVGIAHGYADAMKHKAAWRPYKTKEAAEMAASWWNYEHPRWFERPNRPTT